jgi:hypothetical protein
VKESFEARLCSFKRVMMLTASLAVFSTGSHQGAYCFVGWRNLYLKNDINDHMLIAGRLNKKTLQDAVLQITCQIQGQSCNECEAFLKQRASI